MTARITYDRYPKELTLTLEQFLEKFQLNLTVRETKTGSWFVVLDGAHTPAFYSRRSDRDYPASNILTDVASVSPDAALRAVAERLTNISKLERDGTREILDIRNIRVVPCPSP